MSIAVLTERSRLFIFRAISLVMSKMFNKIRYTVAWYEKTQYKITMLFTFLFNSAVFSKNNKSRELYDRGWRHLAHLACASKSKDVPISSIIFISLWNLFFKYYIMYFFEINVEFTAHPDNCLNTCPIKQAPAKSNRFYCQLTHHPRCLSPLPLLLQWVPSTKCT